MKRKTKQQLLEVNTSLPADEVDRTVQLLRNAIQNEDQHTADVAVLCFAAALLTDLPKRSFELPIPKGRRKLRNRLGHFAFKLRHALRNLDAESNGGGR